MGFLEPKSRLMDVVLTDVGKDRLASGEFDISYYSVSDSGVFYDQDSEESFRMIDRISMECPTSLPQDIISLPTNEHGYVSQFSSTALENDIFPYGGTLLTGSMSNFRVVTPEEFTEKSKFLLASSLDNLKNNFLLGTVDPILDEEEFNAGPCDVNFVINEASYHDISASASIEDFPTLFQDKLFSHLQNYQYLPPVNKASTLNGQVDLLGNYPSYGGNEILTFEDVEKKLSSNTLSGKTREIYFDPAPVQNNMQLQFFEQSQDKLLKLDVVDFGSTPSASGGRRTLFVGKLFTNEAGSDVFSLIFTVVLE